MRHIQLFGMKIYFEGLEIIYEKYILANISQKICAKYILIIQLFAKTTYISYFLTYMLHIYFSMWDSSYKYFFLKKFIKDLMT